MPRYYREPMPWHTDDGRKWCACGDGIDENKDKCDICEYIDDIDIDEDAECVICGERTHGEGIHEDLCADCSQI